MYTYVGFGMHIRSELEFPELMPSDSADSDIYISRSSLRTELAVERNMDQSFFEWQDGVFLFHVPSIGAFAARGGRSIEADLYPNYDEKGMRSFMLNTMLPAVLAQRQQVLMHGSSVIIGDRLALFLGTSGAGKSSTVAELRRRGYTIFCDDVFVLLPPASADPTVYALASYPMMKLKKDTIEAVGDEKNTDSSPIRDSGEKFAQYFHESFQTKPLPVGHVFLLSPGPDHSAYAARPVTGMQAFQALSRNTYRSNFMHERALQRLHAESLSHLIQHTEILELTRPIEGSDIRSFADFIVSLIK